MREGVPQSPCCCQWQEGPGHLALGQPLFGGRGLCEGGAGPGVGCGGLGASRMMGEGQGSEAGRL